MRLQADLENGVDPDKPADLDLHSFQNSIIPGSHDKGFTGQSSAVGKVSGNR